MKKYYSYAGINLCVAGPDEYMYENEKTLGLFKGEAFDNTYNYFFEVVDSLNIPVGEKVLEKQGYVVYMKDDFVIRYLGGDYKQAYMRVEKHCNNHQIQVLKSSLEDKIESHIVYCAIESEKLITEAGGILMHASFIEYRGEAILFTAPSGTGKSTQADLWVKYRNAEIINGDRCAVRFIDGKVYACGVPFAGSSNISKNRTLPLKCIVCLGQSLETTITKLTGYKAFRYLYEGVGVNAWDKEHVEKVTGIVERIIGCTPIYKLDCTPDLSAVEALEEYL